MERKSSKQPPFIFLNDLYIDTLKKDKQGSAQQKDENWIFPMKLY